MGCSGSENDWVNIQTTDGLIQEARRRCTNKDNEPTNTNTYCRHFQHILFKRQLFSIITLITINTLISETKGPVETQVSDSKQEDEGFTWLSWFFNQASSMFYGRHEQTQKVLRKCMNGATVYWVHVPWQETQINTVIAHKRRRMKEERGVKRAYSLSTLSVFDHWSLTLRGPDDFLLWIALARGTFSYRRIKMKCYGCLCIFSNYLKYNQGNLGF